MKLAQLKPQTLEAPPKILIYGAPGTGKSTLAASAPNAIVLHGEDGTKHLTVARLPSIADESTHMPRDYPDVLAMLLAVRDQERRVQDSR